MEQFLIFHGAQVALFIRILSFLLAFIFIIPLMVKQAKVKNGLRIFRWLLLHYGILINIGNLITMWFLLDVIQSHIMQKLLNSELQIVNATIFFAASFIGFLMYHYQFNDKNVEIHRQAEKLTKKQKKS